MCNRKECELAEWKLLSGLCGKERAQKPSLSLHKLAYLLPTPPQSCLVRTQTKLHHGSGSRSKAGVSDSKAHVFLHRGMLFPAHSQITCSTETWATLLCLCPPAPVCQGHLPQGLPSSTPARAVEGGPPSSLSHGMSFWSISWFCLPHHQTVISRGPGLECLAHQALCLTLRGHFALVE